MKPGLFLCVEGRNGLVDCREEYDGVDVVLCGDQYHIEAPQGDPCRIIGVSGQDGVLIGEADQDCIAGVSSTNVRRGMSSGASPGSPSAARSRGASRISVPAVSAS